MTVPLARLNEAPRGETIARLAECCGSQRWAETMADARPFASPEDLFARADEVWASLEPDDWREAFAHHPRIGGDDIDDERFAHTRERARSEQSGMEAADERLRRRLAEGNDAYVRRFGHVFLICATGKSAAEMLAALETRLDNDPDDELRIAAEQQRQITQLRLAALIGGSG